jgi:predicted acylesterase/phospholipase RssA
MRGVIIGLSDDLISNYFELNYNFIIVAASARSQRRNVRPQRWLLASAVVASYSIEYFQKSTTWLERQRVPWSIGYYIFF